MRHCSKGLEEETVPITAGFRRRLRRRDLITDDLLLWSLHDLMDENITGTFLDPISGRVDVVEDSGGQDAVALEEEFEEE